MTIVGNYRLIREIGKGATATVYLGEHLETGQQVAVKRVEFGNERGVKWNRRIRKLFNIEGNVGRVLNHPNIVQVFETVIADDQAYIVMEFLEGYPLDQFITFDKLLPVHQAVGIIFKCCLALDHAYHRGIIHRDIKPANIFVCGKEDAKIMDFGLALDVTKKAVTDSTHITGVGSPAYMSPEQIKGYPLNQKSDIFSLGVVLYQLLTGRLPFRAANSAQLIYKIINMEPDPVSKVNPNVPAVLDKIVKKALEKDLYGRYKNGAEMAKDLSAVRYQILDDNYVPVDTTRFDTLRKSAFFRRFDETELWEVLRISKWRTVEADTVLMREGDQDNAFGILLDGRVEVSLGGKKLDTIEAGECVGEASYLNADVPVRQTTVTTLTPITFLEIIPAALSLATEDCLEHFRLQLVTTMARRLHKANQRLAETAEEAHIGTNFSAFDLELVPMDDGKGAGTGSQVTGSKVTGSRVGGGN